MASTTNTITTTTSNQMDLDVQEFERIASAHLGNANGNIYHSKPGVKGVHDGQVYVRLKKKRFVVLDYTMNPNEADLAQATEVAHMEIPSGAGKTQCITKECTKVGVPVKLFDSNPEDTVSLYLRSGLCFECQRNLNEKRRVDRRKRPGDGAPLLYSIAGPMHKKFKLHGGDVIELKEDAIIVNGSVKGVKLAADGHAPQDIAMDMQDMLRESAFETERLLAAANNSDPMVVDMQTMYEKAFTCMNRAIFLLTQWKAAWDVVSAAAEAASGATADANGNGHTMVSLLLAADKDQQQQHQQEHEQHQEGTSPAAEADLPPPPPADDEHLKKEDEEIPPPVDDDDHHHDVVVHDPADSEVPTFEL